MKIIKAIRENKYITIPEMSSIIKKSVPTIYRHLNVLVEKRLIRRIESRKSGYWEIVEK